MHPNSYIHILKVCDHVTNVLIAVNKEAVPSASKEEGWDGSVFGSLLILSHFKVCPARFLFLKLTTVAFIT